jgi:hypothetical protein
MWNNLFPEVVLGLCRLFLDAPKKYRAIEVWRIPLYFKIVNFLKLSYQGSNLYPMRISEYALNLKVSPARIEPRNFCLGSSLFTNTL